MTMFGVTKCDLRRWLRLRWLAALLAGACAEDLVGPHQSELFGQSVQVADFDGNGTGDLAVGAPYDDLRVPVLDNGHGSVSIFHQLNPSSNGAVAADQLWTEDDPEVGGQVQNDDAFGGGLAAGDFDGSGTDDLVIVAKNYPNTGMLHALYSEVSEGLSTGSSPWALPPPLQPDARMAAGDVNGDGFDDLQVLATDGLTLITYLGSAAGLSPTTTLDLMIASGQATEECTELAEAFPDTTLRFGPLVAGDFDDDGFEDIASGIVVADFSSLQRAILVLHGSADGLVLQGALCFTTTELVGAPDGSFPNIAAGDFDGDGFGDLAYSVGHGPASYTATAGVLFGGRRGGSLTTIDAYSMTYVPAGTLDGSEPSDRVASGDFDGDGYDDLVAFATGPYLSLTRQDLAIHPIRGSASGMVDGPYDPSVVELLGSASFPEEWSSGDLDGDGTDEFVLGAAYCDPNQVDNAGCVYVLAGGPGGLELGEAAMIHQ